MIRLLALLAALTVACVAPSQHSEVTYGRVTVSFGTPIDSAGPWRADQLVELRAELTALNALGPTFVEASEGTAMIVVRPFDSTARTGTCHLAVECIALGSMTVEEDPAQASGYLELRAAMGHGIGHALGMGHVCFNAEDVSGACIRDGHYGPAMMNPSVSYGDIIDASQGDPLGVAQITPTDLDLAEYRRVHP